MDFIRDDALSGQVGVNNRPVDRQEEEVEKIQSTRLLSGFLEKAL
jgi:hypothetical protein